jgi:hypothetical protein
MNPRAKLVARLATVALLLPFAGLLAGTGCSKTAYQCQVICKFPSGQVMPSTSTITVNASSIDAANDDCPAQAEANLGSACGNGAATVQSCSCYVGGAVELEPPLRPSGPVLASMP